ncbi:hemerythrin domain-containing protein [Chloroflexota bacterium]
MNEILALIDQIIEEHEWILPRVKTLQEMASDPEAIDALEEAGADFMPARINVVGQELQNMLELLEKVSQGLKAHFDREEKGLLAAFEKQGRMVFVSALRVLLSEHKEIKDRLARLKADAAELVGGSLSREVWEGKAYGLRAYLSHTCKLLREHAKSEQKLLLKMAEDLKE